MSLAGTTDRVAALARYRYAAERARVKGACRTCGKPLTSYADDCGGPCATVSTHWRGWGVWKSDTDREAPPVAVCTSEDAARAIQRLYRFGYVAPHETYGHRPRLVSDDVREPETETDSQRCYWCDSPSHSPANCTSAWNRDNPMQELA